MRPSKNILLRVIFLKLALLLFPSLAFAQVSFEQYDAMYYTDTGSGVYEAAETGSLYQQFFLRNDGTSDALGVVVRVVWDPNTANFTPGGVSTTLGTVTKGNSIGDTEIEVNVGTLAQNQSATIEFFSTLQYKNSIPGVDRLCYVASVQGTNFAPFNVDKIGNNDANTILAVDDCWFILPPGPPCEAGTFSNEGRGCATCPAGTYNDESGQYSCKACGDGMTSLSGSTSADQCFVAQPALSVPRPVPVMSGGWSLGLLGLWLAAWGFRRLR